MKRSISSIMCIIFALSYNNALPLKNLNKTVYSKTNEINDVNPTITTNTLQTADSTEAQPTQVVFDPDRPDLIDLEPITEDTLTTCENTCGGWSQVCRRCPIGEKCEWDTDCISESCENKICIDSNISTNSSPSIVLYTTTIATSVAIILASFGW